MQKAPTLFADHQNRKGAGYWCPARRTRIAGLWWWSRPALIAHGEDVARLAVQSDRSGAVHRVEILFDFETRGTLLLNDGQSTVAVCAESFHRSGVECCAVGTAGKGQDRQDLPIPGT